MYVTAHAKNDEKLNKLVQKHVKEHKQKSELKNAKKTLWNYS